MEEWVLMRDIDLGRSIFSLGRRSDLTAQGKCQRLHPITDSKDGETTCEDICGDLRRTGFIYRGWSSRDYEAERVVGENFLFRCIVRVEFAIYMGFADSPCDQLSVL
jgi:hypothetical protein